MAVLFLLGNGCIWTELRSALGVMRVEMIRISLLEREDKSEIRDCIGLNMCLEYVGRGMLRMELPGKVLKMLFI